MEFVGITFAIGDMSVKKWCKYIESYRCFAWRQFQIFFCIEVQLRSFDVEEVSDYRSYNVCLLE